MNDFTPDYHHILNAARNVEARRLPLYEHIISDGIMEQVLGKTFKALYFGDENELDEYFCNYCGFFLKMGYDTVSFERCIGPAMPGSGALGEHKPGVIKNRGDFEKYPWDEIPDLYFKKYTPYFEALRRNLPPGMKAIGGPGNGVFECVQDIVGYMDLCYISADDPELYAGLFDRVGKMMFEIWRRFLDQFSD
ncbi:MAG: hypothetical protein P4M02_09610, partial [Clostridia bacterium]|nr:hypothetical protein [Clostridia bacterium]